MGDGKQQQVTWCGMSPLSTVVPFPIVEVDTMTLLVISLCGINSRVLMVGVKKKKFLRYGGMYGRGVGFVVLYSTVMLSTSVSG